MDSLANRMFHGLEITKAKNIRQREMGLDADVSEQKGAEREMRQDCHNDF